MGFQVAFECENAFAVRSSLRKNCALQDGDFLLVVSVSAVACVRLSVLFVA